MKNPPHPLTPSPTRGEGGHDNSTLAPLSRSGRGAGGEGLNSENPPHPLTPSPTKGGGLNSKNPPHPLTPSPTRGEGGQDNSNSALIPLSRSGGQGLRGHEKVQRWEVTPELQRKMVEVARQFRKQPTPSEKILWQALKNCQLDNYKFRRQQPIGVFVVDFFCAAARVVVEVDGGIHESQQELDRQRQELLESLGLKFIRVASDRVENNLSSVLEEIHQVLLTNHGNPPHPNPLPRGEREQEKASIAPLVDYNSCPPSPPVGEGAGG